MSARPPTAPSALKQIWLKWKTLRLPWRRQFLAGADLSGNTFWEFKDAMNAQRFRRIVKYGRNTHYGDVKISRKWTPWKERGLDAWVAGRNRVRQKNGVLTRSTIAQWHQWLRHTRHEAPSIQEQQFDIARRERMKELAAEADERWRSQESFLDAPRTQQPEPAIGTKDPGGYVPMTEPEDKQGVSSAVEEEGKVGRAMVGEKVDKGRFRGKASERPGKGKGKKEGEAPWASQLPKGAPGESWQPGTWTPGAAPRR